MNQLFLSTVIMVQLCHIPGRCVCFVLSFSQITNYKYSALSSVDMTLAQHTMTDLLMSRKTRESLQQLR